VFVFDGEGAEYECEVARVGKHGVELTALVRLADEGASPLRLVLGQALIKGDKFDWVVQKATELGAARIVPLVTEHSDVRQAEGRAEHRLQRWRRIALEAVKQCGRRRLVEIAEPVSFAKFCEGEEAQAKLIFSERGGRRLREVAAGPSVALAIAPEGGWSDGELELADGHHFTPIYLGARILRTETAAIAAVTLAQYLFGDLG
jgi:16S rRNA (uracil1498-N3)-methyltransferase